MSSGWEYFVPGSSSSASAVVAAEAGPPADADMDADHVAAVDGM